MISENWWKLTGIELNKHNRPKINLLKTLLNIIWMQ